VLPTVNFENMNFLIQKQWFRNLFSKRTFYLNDTKWRDLSEFKKGEKIRAIDGKWNTQVFCECGNEMVHSQSFLDERFVKDTNQYVYDYQCSFCGVKSHYNPEIMPGLKKCDKNGIPT